MLIFAIFPILLFFAGAFIIVGLPVALSLQDYRKNRGRQSVICPDSGEPVDVEVDRKFAFWTALRGQEHSRLLSCAHWPEKGSCGQECLEQIDPSPENIEHLLTKWYEGKSCAICTRALSPSDWRRSRLALSMKSRSCLSCATCIWRSCSRAWITCVLCAGIVIRKNGRARRFRSGCSRAIVTVLVPRSNKRRQLYGICGLDKSEEQIPRGPNWRCT